MPSLLEEYGGRKSDQALAARIPGVLLKAGRGEERGVRFRHLVLDGRG